MFKSIQYRYFGWFVSCHEYLVNKKIKQSSNLPCFGRSSVVVIAVVIRVSLSQARFVEKGQTNLLLDLLRVFEKDEMDFSEDLLQTCKPNPLLVFCFSRPAIRYHYLSFQTTLHAFASLWLCKGAGVGKSDPSPCICTGRCKSSCMFNQHTAMYHLDPSRIFES